MKTYKAFGGTVTILTEAECAALPAPYTYTLEKQVNDSWVECARNHHGAFGTIAPKGVVCRVINLNTGNQIGHKFIVN